MLNKIKSMINSKKSYMEAAEIILEDAGHNIDDIIVLGETKAEDVSLPEPEETELPTPEEEPDEGNDPDGEPMDDQKPEDGTEPASGEDDDVLGASAGVEEDEDPEATPDPANENDDLLSGNAEEDTPAAEGAEGDEKPLPLPGDDSLPEVLGKQTGEPPVSNPQDLLDVQVNMGSGTLKDVLPVPPKNAGDAIAGDGDQHVDSGFGSDNGEDTTPEPEEGSSTPPMPEPDAEDILNGDVGDMDADDEGDDHKEPAGEPAKESGEEDLLMSEAISLGGNDQQPAQQPAVADPNAAPVQSTTQPAAAPAPAPAAQPEAAPAATDAASVGGDTGADPLADPTAGLEDPTASATDAGATADPATAVPAAPENDVTAAVKDKVAEAEAPVPNGDDGKEELMKKLSSITKSIEDAKSVVMRSPNVR